MGINFASFLGGMASQYNNIQESARIDKSRKEELLLTSDIRKDEAKYTSDLNFLNSKKLAELQSKLAIEEADAQNILDKELANLESDLEEAADTTFSYWGKKGLTDAGLPELKLRMEFSDSVLKGGTAYNTQLAQINSWNNESIKWLKANDVETYNDLIQTVNGVFKQADTASIMVSDTAKGYLRKNWFRGLDNIQNLEGVGGAFNTFIDENIKERELNDYRKRDAKYYDDVALILSPDKETVDTKPISYDDLAVSAGFVDKTTMFKNVEPLIGLGDNVGSSDPNQIAKFVKNLETNQISLGVLQFSSEINYLQELSFDEIDSVSPAFYENMISKIESVNANLLKQSDATGRVAKLVNLEDIIYVVNATARRKEAQYGDVIDITTNTRDMKGTDWKYNDQDRESQFAAAGKVKISIAQLKSNIQESGNLVGLPSFWAETIAKVKSTGEGFQELFNNFKTLENSDNFVDTSGKMGSVFDQMAKFQADANGADAEAVRKAEREFLKFSIAYQLAMALQGGSGGRTISDQDVDNILQALNMDTLLKNPELMVAALDSIDEFATGLQQMSKWDRTSIKGYTTAKHSQGLYFAQGKIKTTEDLKNSVESKGVEPGSSSDSIGTQFSKFNVSSNDLFTSGSVKVQPYTDKGGNTHTIIYFGDDEKFGNYRGQALIATADIRTEFLNAFYENQRIGDKLKSEYENYYGLSSIEIDPTNEGLIKNPITGERVEILLK